MARSIDEEESMQFSSMFGANIGNWYVATELEIFASLKTAPSLRPLFNSVANREQQLNSEQKHDIKIDRKSHVQSQQQQQQQSQTRTAGRWQALEGEDLAVTNTGFIACARLRSESMRDFLRSKSVAMHRARPLTTLRHWLPPKPN